jgi:uncharacterized short protein YbdD (DUF466 family)
LNRLFIIGIGRSGSTILSKTLGSHPDCLDNPEIPLFSFFYKALRNQRSNSVTNRLIVRFIHAMKRRHPGHPWRIQTEEIAKIPSGLDYFDFMNELSTLFTTESASEKNTRRPHWIIDKNPVNTLHVHHFLKEYPHTRAVFLARDPRANIASRMQSQNLIHRRTNHWMLNALRWRSYNRYYYTLKNKFPDQIHLLRYEDFALNPQQHMDELCDFLRIHHVTLESPNPISSTHIDQNTARLVKKYRDLNATINPHAISRWKAVLDKQTIGAIEDICKTEMDFFRYSRETRVKVPIPGKFRFLAHWYELKEKLIFSLPLSLKLKRLE